MSEIFSHKDIKGKVYNQIYEFNIKTNKSIHNKRYSNIGERFQINNRFDLFYYNFKNTQVIKAI